MIVIKEETRQEMTKKHELRGQDWSRTGSFWMRWNKNELALEFNMLEAFEHGRVC